MSLFTTPDACKRKRTFNTHGEALQTIRHWPRARNKEKDSLNAYHCNVCGKYHVGHKYKPNDSLNKLFNNLSKLEELHYGPGTADASN